MGEKIMKYFYLNPDCVLITGAKKGAIYNLRDGNVYSIDSLSVEIIEKSSQISIDELTVQTARSADKIEKHLQKLVALKLGCFSDKQNVGTQDLIFTPKNKLDFLWLELTDKCNLKCVHCYGCFGDKNCSISISRIKNEKYSVISTEDWIRIIKEGRELNCKSIQFIGGEPTILGKKLFFLMDLAKNCGYQRIELFTNATLLSENNIRKLKNLNAEVAVSLYSHNAETHDSITGKKGSHEKTVKNIKKMENYGLNMRLSLVIMKENEKDIRQSIAFLRNLGGKNSYKGFDIVRPVGKAENPKVGSRALASKFKRKKPIFRKITKENFLRSRLAHNCYLNKACVTATGDVIPCTLSRDYKCGNIKTNSLKEIIFGDKMKKYWFLSKDKIDICKDCEYRYCCVDCRPSAHATSGSLLGKGADCGYDPYSGEWES